MGRKDKQTTADDDGVISLGARLRLARQERKLALTALAERLRYTKGYLSGVENGKIRASHDLLRGYERELGLAPGSFEPFAPAERILKGVEPHFWYLPYPRNPFFSGRDEVLTTIATRLEKISVPPRVLALAGLGGIGKTQVANEFAYRYQEQYRGVFWLQAQSEEALTDSLAEISTRLGLIEVDDLQGQSQAVIHWLRDNQDCLLILDNVEDLEIISSLVSEVGNQSILLTTRMQFVGMLASILELKEMELEESRLLLFRRAKILDESEIALHLANQIATLLGGLPLALNQAGAYIEQTGCGLSRYLRLLETRQSRVLQERDPFVQEYPASVATTWSLSFEKIRKANAAAADLLRLCAFLHPDLIYEEFLMEGAGALGPLAEAVRDPDTLHRAISELRRYSLVRTDPISGALSIHRLVQVVVQDSLSDTGHQIWCQRAVGTAALAFPSLEIVDEATWSEQVWTRCQRYFLQAESCVDLLRAEKLAGPEYSELLRRVGRYLEERNHLQAAEQLYLEALAMDQGLYAEENLDLAHDLHRLAVVAQKQEHYQRSEEFYKQAMFVQDRLPGTERFGLWLLKDYVGLLRKTGQQGDLDRLNQRMRESLSRFPSRIVRRVIINDDDPRIEYQDKEQNWEQRRLLDRDDYNNDVHFTTVVGACFKHTFTGTGIEILSDPTFATGTIRVFIDEVLRQTVNLSHLESRFTQTIIFAATTLEVGEHHLRVELREGTFMLDALAVYVEDSE